MAKAVTSKSAVKAPAPSASPPTEKRRSPHRVRFLLAYALLGAIGGIALVLGAGLLERSDGSARDELPPRPTWSSWYPTAEGMAGANQIAQHVGRRYRLQSGDQLVGVRAGPLSVQNLRVSAIALRTAGEGSGGSDISVIPADRSISYVLCGLGENCSIEGGKPTRGRERLLRRQALELALYTFSYMEVDSVVAFLPPRPDAEALWSFLFRRAAFREELEQPLRFTIPESDPPFPGKMTRIEVARIDRLTEPSRYRFQFSQSQDGTVLLVLDPPSLAEGNGE
jgi:hypothetical protein